MNKISLSRPNVGLEEAMAVQKVMETGWIGPNGPEVFAFEKDLQAYLNHEAEVLALSSGTAALHLAFKVLNIGIGDIVLLQSFSFGAPAFAASYLGAHPIFIDSEVESWNMDPYFLKQALEFYNRKGELKRIKAIVPVYAYGNPPKMRKIQDLAMEYKVPLVVDAAEAVGSVYKGQKAELYGDLVILSFNANKILSTGGGGALIGLNKALIGRARLLANQGKEFSNNHYQHLEIGFNYAMNSIAAAIGRVQLLKVSDFVEKRRNIFRTYCSALEPNKMQGQSEIIGAKSNRWLSAFKTENADSRQMLLHSLEMEIKPVFKPIHLQDCYRGAKFFGSGIAENLFHTGLVFPSGKGATVNKIRQALPL